MHFDFSTRPKDSSTHRPASAESSLNKHEKLPPIAPNPYRSILRQGARRIAFEEVKIVNFGFFARTDN